MESRAVAYYVHPSFPSCRGSMAGMRSVDSLLQTPYSAPECSPVQQRVHHLSIPIYCSGADSKSTGPVKHPTISSLLQYLLRGAFHLRAGSFCSVPAMSLFPRPFRHCPCHQSPAPFRRIPRRMPPDCPIAPAAFMLHKSRSTTQLFTGRTTNSAFPLVIATQEMTLETGLTTAFSPGHRHGLATYITLPFGLLLALQTHDTTRLPCPGLILRTSIIQYAIKSVLL